MVIAVILLLVMTSDKGSVVVEKVLKTPLRMRRREKGGSHGKKGKNGKNGKKKKNDNNSHAESMDCFGTRFRKKTMKLLDEKPIAALIPDMPHRRYEASDVTPLSNGSALILADNAHDMVKISTRTPFFHDPNMDHVVTWKGKSSKVSEFEALTRNYTSGNFIAIKETHKRKGAFVAKMQDFRIRGREIVPGEVCFSEWTFKAKNKGFEGAADCAEGAGSRTCWGCARATTAPRGSAGEMQATA